MAWMPPPYTGPAAGASEGERPQSGDRTGNRIPAKKSVKFKAGKEFADKMNS
jgi:Bacterial nucleoid DNA-binding protein